LEVTSNIGYRKTRKQIKAVVEKIACEKGVLRKGEVLLVDLGASWSGNLTCNELLEWRHQLYPVLGLLFPDV